MASAAPAREAEREEHTDDDSVRWLAMLLLKVAVILANGVRQRYALGKGERCPRCGHSF